MHSGDFVLLARGSKPVKRVVVVDSQRDTWLYEARGRQLEYVEQSQARALWSQLTLMPRRVGMSASLKQQIQRALSTLHLARKASWRDVLALSGVLVFASGIAGGVSLYLKGAIGVFAPLLFAFLGAWVFHRYQALGDERLLSRPAMLWLGHRVALVSGSLATLFFVLGSQGAIAAKVLIVVWIGAVAASGVCALLAGDLALWQMGGYPGEGGRLQKGPSEGNF